MSILYSLRPSLPSFETTQKHADFSHTMPPQKSFSYPLHLYQSPVLSPPCRPYLTLRRYGFTLHISVRLPVISCPTLSPTRMRFVLRLSFRTDDEPCVILLQWITIMSPRHRRPCELKHRTILREKFVKYTGAFNHSGKVHKQRLLLAVDSQTSTLLAHDDERYLDILSFCI